MKKEKRDISIQIRITPREKQIINEIRELDKEFHVSRLFREKLQDHYTSIISDKSNGIGDFIVN